MNTIPIFLVGILVLTAVAGACGGGGEEPPEVSALSTAKFETCTGFLELVEVQKAAGRSDVSIGEPNVNSGPQDPGASGITAMCVIEYVTPEILIGGPGQLRISGPSMTLTAIAFDSAESAETHQELVLQSVQLTGGSASPQSQVLLGVLGDESYFWTTDAEGVGSVVGFLLGPNVVQLHTTLPESAALLVGPQDLRALAGTVKESLETP